MPNISIKATTGGTSPARFSYEIDNLPQEKVDMLTAAAKDLLADVAKPTIPVGFIVQVDGQDIVNEQRDLSIADVSAKEVKMFTGFAKFSAINNS